ARAARAAGSVSPSARACTIRRALTPSRSETRLDNLMWYSSSNASNRFWSCTRLPVSWYFVRVTVRHRRCSGSGTKLRVSSFAPKLAPFKCVLAVDFDVGDDHGQHPLVNINSSYLVRHVLLLLLGAESVPSGSLKQGHRLSRSHQSRSGRPIIRPTRTLRIRHS